MGPRPPAELSRPEAALPGGGKAGSTRASASRFRAALPAPWPLAGKPGRRSPAAPRGALCRAPSLERLLLRGRGRGGGGGARRPAWAASAFGEGPAEEVRPPRGLTRARFPPAARGSERAGGEGPQQPLRQRADAGRAEVLRHPGQPAHGRREHHGPADKEHRRGPHLQHHRRHDQQDNRARHGQGGHSWRLHQQEVLRDGQPLAAVAVLTRLLVPSVVLLMERCEDVQDGSDRPGRPALPLRDQPRHTIAAYSNFSCSQPLLPPPLLLFFSNAPTLPQTPLLPSISFLPFFFYHKSLLLPNFLVVTRCSFFDEENYIGTRKNKNELNSNMGVSLNVASVFLSLSPPWVSIPLDLPPRAGLENNGEAIGAGTEACLFVQTMGELPSSLWSLSVVS